MPVTIVQSSRNYALTGMVTRISAVSLLLLILISPSWGQEPLVRPEVDEPHQKFFAHFNDSRSVPIPVLNQLSLDPTKVGRSFALIAGISTYPKLPAEYRDLQPASEDIGKLADYLEKVEYFDEIVVLKNEDVTDDNLAYFLQGYFADRLQKYPNSRLLIAYSGHGFKWGTSSFALSTNSTSLTDKYHSLNLYNLRNYIEFDQPYAHYVLALLNTCNSGAFVNRPFGGNGFDLYAGGAHAITAGTIDQLAWSYPDVGSGSLLFEKLFAALDGRANRIEPLASQTTGIVTFTQLFRYLSTQIADKTNRRQTPDWGDLDPAGSRGSFYFFDRAQLVDNHLVAPWQSTPLGSTPLSSASSALAFAKSDLRVAAADIRIPAQNFSINAQIASLESPSSEDLSWPPNAVEGGSYIVRPDEQTRQIHYLKLPRNFTLSFDAAIQDIHWTVDKMEFETGSTIDLSPPHIINGPGPAGVDVPGQPEPGVSGKPGGKGGNGADGRNGRNLTLEILELEPHGLLWVKTDGASGGPGGRGGNGQIGGPANCGILGIQRTQGGQGGLGGPGGEGGKGGSISVVKISIDKVSGRDSSKVVIRPENPLSVPECGSSERPNGLFDDGVIAIFGRPGCGGLGGGGGAAGPGGDEGTTSKCRVLGFPALRNTPRGIAGTPGLKGKPGDPGHSFNPLI